MKKGLLLLFYLTFICFIANTQEINSLCFENAGYDEKTIGMEDALANPAAVIILDLSLQDPKLTIIPKEISKFSNLKSLNVSFNRIGSIHPDFKNLQNIQCLDLSGNHYLQKLPEFLNEKPSSKVIKKEQTEKQFPNIQFIW